MDLSGIVPQVSIPKRKVETDFWGYGQNCLGIKGQKGSKNNIFVILCINCSFLY